MSSICRGNTLSFLYLIYITPFFASRLRNIGCSYLCQKTVHESIRKGKQSVSLLITAPDGYTVNISESNPITVIKNNQTYTIDIGNTRVKGSITLQKEFDDTETGILKQLHPIFLNLKFNF